MRNLAILGALVLVIGSAEAEGACPTLLRPTKASINGQNAVAVKIIDREVGKMVAFLRSDQRHPGHSRAFQEVTIKMLRFVLRQKFKTKAEYDFAAEVFAVYLEFRPTLGASDNINPDEVFRRLRVAAARRLEVLTASNYLVDLPLDFLRILGISSYEEVNFLRAHGLSPIASVDRPEFIDGLTRSINEVSEHDRAHFMRWQQNISDYVGQDGIDAKQTLAQAKSFFEGLIESLDKSHLNSAQKELVHFFYFLISHERNVDIIGAKSWLFYLARDLVSKDRPDLFTLDSPVTQAEIKKIFESVDLQRLGKLQAFYGWPHSPSSQRELNKALGFIFSML